MPTRWSDNGYNYNRRNFETIQNLIQDGLSEMRKNPTDAIFQIWFNYSYKILSLATSSDPRIANDYMSFGQTLITTYLNPYDKFSRCLDYLIEILKYV